jgi:hypothetical protein
LASIWPIAPILDNVEHEAVGGTIGRGNQSILKNPAPVSLRPLQIPHDMPGAQTRAIKLGIQRLAAM